jgi:PP-loop superfamily ATP-utilizing enzyme
MLAVAVEEHITAALLALGEQGVVDHPLLMPLEIQEVQIQVEGERVEHNLLQFNTTAAQAAPES